MDALLSTDARVARLDVILADSTSLPGAADFVRYGRGLAANRSGMLQGAHALVGGYVAENLDFQDAMLRVFPLIAAAIFVATAIMLALVFRSVLVPVKAVVLNILSVSAAFGLIVLVFQNGVGGRWFGLAGPPGAVFVAIPVLVFTVVFGLSMDYEVFLLGRIKEEFDRTNDNTAATIAGLTATASVITPAALLMIVVFGVFAFTRVLVIQVLGFGLAVAVLLDATVIRLVMVPALMYLAGRWNWWPGVRRAPRE
jgi:RND superfamily putative drug exporter